MGPRKGQTVLSQRVSVRFTSSTVLKRKLVELLPPKQYSGDKVEPPKSEIISTLKDQNSLDKASDVE
jgi:hypothetical protein